MTTYSVVVESGSCSPDYQRWEERAHCGHNHKTIAAAEKCRQKRAHCGHNHKTIAAAEKCRQKLTRWYCNHGRIQGTPCRHCLGYAQGHSTSATWYNATIHNQDQERVGGVD